MKLCLRNSFPLKNMPHTLEEILSDYRQTSKHIQEEILQRAKIMQSEEYVSLQRQIDASLAFQNDMLKTIPDSSEEYAMDKQELIKYMQEHQIHSAGEFRARTRIKRIVDTRKVLEAMQGDIDNMMLVASVRIKDLEEFARANPEYGKDLRSCIVEEGFTIVDIEDRSSSQSASL